MENGGAKKKMVFDKSTAGCMLGRRVTGILMKRRKPGAQKVADNRIFLMFDDGGGFELFCTGQILPKQVEQCMAASRLLTLDKERYDNEFVAVSRDDGKGYDVLVNKPFVLD